MIGFVTWPPFSYQDYYKGGQVTKPIILVKIFYKLLYVIQVVFKTSLIFSDFLASADIKDFGRTYGTITSHTRDTPRVGTRVFACEMQIFAVYVNQIYT